MRLIQQVSDGRLGGSLTFDGMGQHFTGYSTGSMPEVACPDLLNMQAVTELANDGFDQPPRVHSLPDIAGGTVIDHVGA